MNNKSRAEQSRHIIDYNNDNEIQSEINPSMAKKRRRSININKTKHDNDDQKVSSKLKKSKSPSKKRSTSNKYVPGEYIYDTKGQLAEIKYIGQVE